MKSSNRTTSSRLLSILSIGVCALLAVDVALVLFWYLHPTDKNTNYVLMSVILLSFVLVHFAILTALGILTDLWAFTRLKLLRQKL